MLRVAGGRKEEGERNTHTHTKKKGARKGAPARTLSGSDEMEGELENSLVVLGDSQTERGIAHTHTKKRTTGIENTGADKATHKVKHRSEEDKGGEGGERKREKKHRG